MGKGHGEMRRSGGGGGRMRRSGGVGEEHGEEYGEDIPKEVLYLHGSNYQTLEAITKTVKMKRRVSGLYIHRSSQGTLQRGEWGQSPMSGGAQLGMSGGSLSKGRSDSIGGLPSQALLPTQYTHTHT